MSFDIEEYINVEPQVRLNPFGTGQCLSTWIRTFDCICNSRSQSLWNRAMSFDELIVKKQLRTKNVSIPLEQGNVFRQKIIQSIFQHRVSIPLEQGNVFRLQWGVRALCGKASQSHFPTFSDV